MYSDEELARLYPADYYAYQNEPRIGRLKRQVKKFLGYWSGTKEPYFKHPGKFLDVGCGSGNFLEKQLQAGWDCYGVEISQSAASLGRSRGFDIRLGSLHECRFPSGYFDYIRASHSLEHVTRPRETLQEISRVLKSGGTLLLALPNVDSVAARLFKKYWWHLCAPVHPFGFSVYTIKRLLTECGFEINTVRFNSDYVGILGSLQIWLNRNNGKRSSQGRIFNSSVLRVLSGWLQKTFDLCGCGDMVEVTATKPVHLHESLAIEPPVSADWQTRSA